MENFEFEKSAYLNELKDVLFTEEMSISDYAKKLGEENIELIKNPKSFGELNLVKRALELFIKLSEISKTEEFDPENNAAYTVAYLTAKGVVNNEYFDYAAELTSQMSSTEYLKGKFIVDALCIPKGALDSTFEHEMRRSDDPFIFTLGMFVAPLIVAAKTSELNLKNGIKDEETQDEIEEGIPTYLHNNECVLTYLREREMNSQEKDYVRKYRIEKCI